MLCVSVFVCVQAHNTQIGSCNVVLHLIRFVQAVGPSLLDAFRLAVDQYGVLVLIRPRDLQGSGFQRSASAAMLCRSDVNGGVHGGFMCSSIIHLRTVEACRFLRVLRNHRHMEVSFVELNGEMFSLEVDPEMTGWELKLQLKDRQVWEDEITRKTTRVEIVLGDSELLENDETVAGAWADRADSLATVVLKENRVICSNKDAFAEFGSQIDLGSFMVVEIPKNLTEIIPSAFHKCCNLAKLVIADSVTHIGAGAFEGCSALVGVTVPNSVTQIGDRAFANCSSLSSVVIPDSVTQIGRAAFTGCSSLASVRIPDSMTHIEDLVFDGCISLESVIIPNTVTWIGAYAFRDCRSLISLIIPDSVTRIGDGAFCNCSSLTSVTIPKSVYHIGDFAFSDLSDCTYQ